MKKIEYYIHVHDGSVIKLSIGITLIYSDKHSLLNRCWDDRPR